MMVQTLAKLIFALGLGLSLSARSEDYPSKPIKLIVPVATGAAFDTVTRMLAEKLRNKWGQPVIVENRAGASHNMGAEAVSRSAPDGYTMLFAPPPALVINKSLFSKLAYEPDAFVPVSVVVSTYNVLVVNNSVPAENVQQLIAYAKANPERLNYASAGSGSTPHLAAEMFKTMAGIKIAHIPFKGTSQAILELMGGRVDIMFDTVLSASRFTKAGLLKSFGVTTLKRVPLMSETPTLNESGLSGFEITTWLGIVAPAGLPPQLTQMLAFQLDAFTKDPDSQKQLDALGLLVDGSGPQAFSTFIEQESARMDKLIKSAGIQFE